VPRTVDPLVLMGAAFSGSPTWKTRIPLNMNVLKSRSGARGAGPVGGADGMAVASQGGIESGAPSTGCARSNTGWKCWKAIWSPYLNLGRGGFRIIRPGGRAEKRR